MITLHAFGPALGLPDPSPFVRKTMLQLVMSGLPFRVSTGFAGFRKAPKGKLPWIDDDGVAVADSAFIRRHLETAHGIDFDAGYDAHERAVAFAVERMLEEHFYFAGVYYRWIHPPAWAVAKPAMFARMPALLRAVVPELGRRKAATMLQAQGMGRHSPDEIVRLADADLAAVEAILGDKPFLLGDRPCGADCTVAAFTATASVPPYASPLKDAVLARPRLIAHRDRVIGLYGRLPEREPRRA